MALPSIIRVSAVFMLVMCLFAMVFMEFFGLTKYGHTGSNNSNFRNYGNALLLLVRMTTGEGWVRKVARPPSLLQLTGLFSYSSLERSDDGLHLFCTQLCRLVQLLGL